jgi:hypothetical protein
MAMAYGCLSLRRHIVLTRAKYIGLNECLDRGRRAFSAKVIANEANEYHRIELVYRKAPTTGLSILVK